MNPGISEHKPIIGFTCGDVNGVGAELIIKTLSDARILEICTPVVFASNKVINFYRKSVPEIVFNFMNIKELSRVNHKQANVYNCWEEEVSITPGVMNEIGGKYAIKSLLAAAQALKENKIHGLVTEHVPVKDIAQYITRENITSKLHILHASLQQDFGIDKPKIAVLGLNPHAGDEGLIGKEEEEIIKPAVKDAKQRNMLVMGPFSADAFFARAQYEKFDAVLAMYHDQGLIPFKSLLIGEGVNYTAGIAGIRTSPDHGTAFDIAGKNQADEGSFRAAIFTCIDIINNRKTFEENRKNPLKKVSAAIVANAVDEKIVEES